MTLQLRQLCLVAESLEPTLEALTAILGINRCFVDPGVAAFGLENTLMPIGSNFLEVVAPTRAGTAAGRYLERRGGDGGYMVITQADSVATQQAVLANAGNNGVRIAHEVQRGDWHLAQLHPGDLQAAFLEVETDAHNDFTGHWHPVGGSGWKAHVRQDVVVDYLGVELQAQDPLALAQLWASVIGAPLATDTSEPTLRLNNASLRFVAATDGRGPGLSGIDVLVADRSAVLAAAQQRDCLIDDHQVSICGTRFYLHDAR